MGFSKKSINREPIKAPKAVLRIIDYMLFDEITSVLFLRK